MEAGTGGDGIAFKTLGGEGPDCLLLHGFGSDRLSWLANSSALMAIARVHVLDLPGHGESGTDVGDGAPDTLADRLSELFAAKGLTRLHLVGHSLGGGLALLLAARQPGLAASLTLIAPAGLGKGIDGAFLAAFPECRDAGAATALLQRLVARPHLINRITAERVLAQLERTGARDALRRIAYQLMASEAQFSAAAVVVAAAGLPRLVIWGANDSINPADETELQSFGGGRLVIAGAAHLPHIEMAKAVNEAMAGQLRREAA